jgi:hypothetical protein
MNIDRQEIRATTGQAATVAKDKLQYAGGQALHASGRFLGITGARLTTIGKELMDPSQQETRARYRRPRKIIRGALGGAAIAAGSALTIRAIRRNRVTGAHDPYQAEPRTARAHRTPVIEDTASFRTTDRRASADAITDVPDALDGSSLPSEQLDQEGHDQPVAVGAGVSATGSTERPDVQPPTS